MVDDAEELLCCLIPIEQNIAIYINIVKSWYFISININYKTHCPSFHLVSLFHTMKFWTFNLIPWMSSVSLSGFPDSNGDTRSLSLIVSLVMQTPHERSVNLLHHVTPVPCSVEPLQMTTIWPADPWQPLLFTYPCLLWLSACTCVLNLLRAQGRLCFLFADLVRVVKGFDPPPSACPLAYTLSYVFPLSSHPPCFSVSRSALPEV